MSFANDDNVTAKEVDVIGNTGNKITIVTTSGGSAQVRLYPNDYSDPLVTNNPGVINASDIGSGGGENAILQIAGPYPSKTSTAQAGSQPVLQLVSGRLDETDGSSINIQADDVTLNSVSLPRGIVVTTGAVVASNAIGTTETAVLTIPSTTYQAGRAYRVYLRSGVFSTTAGEWAFSRLFKTNTSGQILGEWLRTACPTASDVYAQCGHIEFIVGSADVTATLIVSLRAKSATVVQFANSTAPRYATVEDIGSADLVTLNNPYIITLV